MTRLAEELGDLFLARLAGSDRQAQRLASNTTTLASEYARQGKDWETELRQRAKEVALMKELGLTIQEPRVERSSPAATDPAKETDEPDSADEAA